MKKILFLIPLVIGLALGLPAHPAWACTPPPGGLPHYTTAEHVQAAPVVLEGVVSYTASLNFGVNATVQVIQYIKGSGPATLNINNFGDGSVCLSHVSDGDHFIFLATGDPLTGQLKAFYLSQFDATLPTDSQTLADAIAAAGQDPVVIPTANTALTLAASTVTPDLDTTSLVATVNAAAGAGNVAATPTPFANLTQAWATLDASASQVANLAAGALPTPIPTPTPTPISTTSVEAVSLVGVGIVIGLIFGVLLGIVGGLFIGRWRE